MSCTVSMRKQSQLTMGPVATTMTQDTLTESIKRPPERRRTNCQSAAATQRRPPVDALPFVAGAVPRSPPLPASDEEEEDGFTLHTRRRRRPPHAFVCGVADTLELPRAGGGLRRRRQSTARSPREALAALRWRAVEGHGKRQGSSLCLARLTDWP
ncbi:Protein of unknown function [Gryllus bimaculatus]|nr:Protein of unknown function [Gryllus bimaculatus]